MAYSDDYVERKAGISTGAKIAVALVALIGLPIVAAFAFGIYSTFLVGSETRLVRALDSSPEARSFFSALKRHNPGDYAALNTAALQAVELGNGQSGVMLILRKSIEFQHAHGAEAADAPDDKLVSLLAAQIAILRINTKKPQMCKQSLSGAPGQMPKTTDLEDTQLGASQTLFVASAAAGREHPLHRRKFDYNDQQALFAELGKRKVASSELSSLGTPAVDTATSLRRCVVALALLESVQALPKAQSMRVFAQLLRAS